jgi:hypothetical protein
VRFAFVRPFDDELLDRIVLFRVAQQFFVDKVLEYLALEGTVGALKLLVVFGNTFALEFEQVFDAVVVVKQVIPDITVIEVDNRVAYFENR